MNKETFELEMEESIIRSKKTLLKKGKEYTDAEGDRLGQFYRAGSAQDIEPTEALIGMATKHYTSICDMVKDPYSYNLKQWNEKVGDLRNYTFLLDALLRDMEVE